MTDIQVRLSALDAFSGGAVGTAAEFSRAGKDVAAQTVPAGAFGTIRRSGDLAAAVADFTRQHGDRALDGGRAIGFIAEAAQESRQRYAQTDADAALWLQQLLSGQSADSQPASPFGTSDGGFGLRL